MPAIQAQLYPHVDPTHRFGSVRDSLVWKGMCSPMWNNPRGRPQGSFHEQVDRSCYGLLRMGRGTAWIKSLPKGPYIRWVRQRDPQRMLSFTDCLNLATRYELCRTPVYSAFPPRAVFSNWFMLEIFIFVHKVVQCPLL